MVGNKRLFRYRKFAIIGKNPLIVGVISHEQNQQDSYTLPEILRHVEALRGKAAKLAVCDRGCRGKDEVGGTGIILPRKALKRDTRYQRDKSANNAKDAQRLSQLSVI